MTTGISICRLLKSFRACLSSTRSRDPGAYERTGSFTGVGILAAFMTGNVNRGTPGCFEDGMSIFLSAGGYHHHIGLNTWAGRGAPQPPPGTTGFYHLAILFPTVPR